MLNLAKICVGSHLYGTEIPTSDHDYKGIFLPSLEQVVLGNHLGNCPKSINLGTGNDVTKNTKDDIDFELYSLQYFLHLAQHGQTIAIEMLFAPPSMWVTDSKEWQYLHNRRHDFLCKNMNSFFGYCRTQATKYSTKGVRLLTLEKVLAWLETVDFGPDRPLIDVWDQIPILPYSSKYVESTNNAQMWSICGRKFHDTACVEYVYEQLTQIMKSYGQRAYASKINEGVDWKAVSHAFRIGYELKEILTTEDLKFPLAEAEFLRELKLGKLNFLNDHLEEKLETLLSELDGLAEKSDLPEQPTNMKELKNWVVSLYA